MSASPGPWYFDSREKTITLYDKYGEHVVATVETLNLATEEWTANGKLLAAARLMLQVLREIEADKYPLDPFMCGERLAKIRAVIRIATGDE